MAVTRNVYVTEKRSEQSKKYQGGAKQSEQSYSDVGMYETSTVLNPVAAFEFYLDKTYPDCKKDSKQSYHQKYKICKRPALVQKWYSG